MSALSDVSDISVERENQKWFIVVDTYPLSKFFFEFFSYHVSLWSNIVLAQFLRRRENSMNTTTSECDLSELGEIDYPNISS
jgi:hypothetical protein